MARAEVEARTGQPLNLNRIGQTGRKVIHCRIFEII